jgi:hypothetical protein
MKVSHHWLTLLLKKLGATPAEVASRLTAAGVEVEGIEEEALAFAGMFVGEITALGPHPNAEKLQLATLSLGAESIVLVSGRPTEGRRAGPGGAPRCQAEEWGGAGGAGDPRRSEPWHALLRRGARAL